MRACGLTTDILN